MQSCKYLVGILTLGACGGGGARPKAAEEPASAPIDAAVAAPPLPLAVARSADRKDWPCGVDVMVGKRKALTEVVMTYGGPATCFIPIDIQADGIIGCPARMTYTRLDRGTVTESTFTYDETGHLDGIVHSTGKTTFVWNGDTLVSRGNANEGYTATSYRYVEVGEAVELIRDTDAGPKAEFLLSFDAGKLVEVEIPEFKSVATIAWEGDRIRRVDTVAPGYKAFQRPLYDCE